MGKWHKERSKRTFAGTRRLTPGEALCASLLSAALSRMWAGSAHELGATCAYIDPGSGSLLLQLVIAFFVGLLFYLRSVRDFIARAIRGLRFRKKPDAE